MTTSKAAPSSIRSDATRPHRTDPEPATAARQSGSFLKSASAKSQNHSGSGLFPRRGMWRQARRFHGWFCSRKGRSSNDTIGLAAVSSEVHSRPQTRWQDAAHAGISGTAVVGADSNAVLRQPDRLRHRAAGPGQHHRHDARQNDVGADKLSPRPADRHARPRPPDVAAIFPLDRRHLLHGDFGRSLWQNTPVAELLGARLPVTFELGLMALIVALIIAHADRHLFGDPAGHGRRLHRPLVLDPDAGGAELLDGHHGDGVSVDLVGLVAGGELRRLHATIRCRTSSR